MTRSSEAFTCWPRLPPLSSTADTTSPAHSTRPGCCTGCGRAAHSSCSTTQGTGERASPARSSTHSVPSRPPGRSLGSGLEPLRDSVGDRLLEQIVVVPAAQPLGEAATGCLVELGPARGRVGHGAVEPVSYTHLRAHETRHDLVCRLLL